MLNNILIFVQSGGVKLLSLHFFNMKQGIKFLKITVFYENASTRHWPNRNNSMRDVQNILLLLDFIIMTCLG